MVQEIAKEWGNMTPTQRVEILQQMRDTYPQEYVDYIEKYFKGLSEQP